MALRAELNRLEEETHLLGLRLVRVQIHQRIVTIIGWVDGDGVLVFAIIFAAT